MGAYEPVKRESSDNYSDKESDVVYVPPPRRSPWRRALYYVFLLVLAGGWFLSIELYRRPRFINYPGLSQPHPFPSEIFTRVKKVFEPDSRYIGPSNQTHQNWDHLVAGHDALYIENPEKYGLMRGTTPPFHHENMASPPPKNFYVVSLMHKLHCLNLIRFHYWQVKGIAPATEGYTEAAWDAHMDHCFEYLRQSISCGSDFAIEGYSPLIVEGQPGHASSVTAWGIEHDCINWDALWAFQNDQERIYNSTWQT